VGKEKFNMRDQRSITANASVSFFSHFQATEQFDRVFKEGMGLVEETANYLDGEGRTDSRALDRPVTIAYATESMRLTTRLMQLASWLLLQRAIAAGEVTEFDAAKEKSRVNLAEIGKGNDIPGGDKLPDGLKELVTRSLRLHERIVVMDKMLNSKIQEKAANENPVMNQLDQLAKAFARG
jgi:regulator of CtrA degradation